jgi:hypothetical protein
MMLAWQAVQSRAAPVRFLGQRPGCYRRNQETADKKAYRGRLSLLNALSDALERHTVKNVPQALKLEAAHYFGSLEKAIATLKKQGKRLPGWNRRKIMTILSRMHRSKDSLAYAKARRDVPALVSAAEAHFGSWGLYAVGIDPNLYFVRRKWCKPRVGDKS